MGKGGGELSVVLDIGIPGDAEAQVGSHQSCLQERGAGLGVHAAPLFWDPPCSGGGDRQGNKHVMDVFTGFAKCRAAPTADRVSMDGLCEEATTAGPRGWFENMFQRGTNQVNEGLYTELRKRGTVVTPRLSDGAGAG